MDKTTFELNYAIHESIGKWKAMRLLAQLGMYESVRTLRIEPCGLCGLVGECDLCPAIEQCSDLSGALGFTLEHAREGPAILAAIDNVLLYLEELKVII